MKNPDGDLETWQKPDELRMLERQNEELRQSLAAAEAARDRYFGLYDQPFQGGLSRI